MSTATGSHEASHAIVACTAQLTGALDAVAGAPAWSMTPDEQRAVLGELTRTEARLVELRLRVLAAADLNQVGADSGASSTAAWLAHDTVQTQAAAHRDVRLAGLLDKDFETTRTALAQGRVNTEQAQVILTAIQALPETVTTDDRMRAEEHLVELAAQFDAKALRHLGRRLFEVIDPDNADKVEGEQLEKEEARARRTRFFKLRDNGDGTSSGSFKIPTLHGEMLLKALQALCSPHRLPKDAWVDADGKKIAYPRLLGRAFCELIEHLDTDHLPDCGGLAATIVVTLDYHQLLSGLGAATLDTGGRISASQARRLACEAGIIPMVLGGDSVLLDLGQERRFHNKYQRIAIGHRDKKCVTDNCDRPPGWCECHHWIPWSQGGPTTVEDGGLLCPWHHHRAHDPGYDMTRMPNGQVRFTRRT